MMYTEGARLRDAGMASVLAGAKAEWRREYRAAVIEWFDGLPHFYMFTGEALRIAAERHGIGKPQHHNAWGAMANGVLRNWIAKKEIIYTGGRASASAPAAHARSYPEYLKL